MPLIKGQQRALPSGDTAPASLLPRSVWRPRRPPPQGHYCLRTSESPPPGGHSTRFAAPCVCVHARVPERQAGWFPDHLKADLHFAGLDGMKKGPVELQALATMFHPLVQAAPCPLLLMSPALILWAGLQGWALTVTLVWTHEMSPYPSWSCWPLRLGLGSVKLHIY